MIIKDAKGNELLEIIQVTEDFAEKSYSPVNHALVVVKIGNEYLMGWNHWRKNWEIFGGCKEEGESIRECIVREAYEELGLKDVKYEYLGLMHFKMAPGYFNKEWHEEYGALYGVTLSEDKLDEIEKYRSDKEEVEKLAFYRDIKQERIAAIDEWLLTYYEDFRLQII